MRITVEVGLGLALMVLSIAALAASDTVNVSQKGRAFGIASVQLLRGQVMRITNNDVFLHQVYIAAPSFIFESDEQEPGTSIDIPFTKAGLFEVRCHIHPKMLLKVAVQ